MSLRDRNRRQPIKWLLDLLTSVCLVIRDNRVYQGLCRLYGVDVEEDVEESRPVFTTDSDDPIEQATARRLQARYESLRAARFVFLSALREFYTDIIESESLVVSWTGDTLVFRSDVSFPDPTLQDELEESVGFLRIRRPDHSIVRLTNITLANVNGSVEIYAEPEDGQSIPGEVYLHLTLPDFAIEELASVDSAVIPVTQRVLNLASA